MMNRLWGWTLLFTLLATAEAQQSQYTVSPAAATPDEESNNTDGPGIALSSGAGNRIAANFSIIGLTNYARNQTPLAGLSGGVYIANASSQLGIASNNIVLISCDPYTGNLQPAEVLAQAEGRGATAVLLYSESSDSCTIRGDGPVYASIYAMNRLDDTKDMLNIIRSLSSVYATIAPRDLIARQVQSGGNNDTSSSAQQGPLGPSPSTAVAMIILYSITGVITALFLVIIISGAVRAHRHPERYGPRNSVGRPRQSRARGMARAMLDTIPIVKFGDREQDRPKQSDVELAEGSRGSAEVLPHSLGNETRSDQDGNVPNDEKVRDSTAHAQGTDGTSEGGIGAAVDKDRYDRATETQGCSICTEDFEMGQDQRVLPCDHRFHPDCIDPWLLNVSGTCPLCRIDLRPAHARTSLDAVDEHGNPVSRSNEGSLAPPLENDSSARPSVGRSIMLSLMGIRPERMTREERLRALRIYREEQAGGQHPVPVEEETSTRRRLRNAFRIRTRRTGAEDDVDASHPERSG